MVEAAGAAGSEAIPRRFAATGACVAVFCCEIVPCVAQARAVAPKMKGSHNAFHAWVCGYVGSQIFRMAPHSISKVHARHGIALYRGARAAEGAWTPRNGVVGGAGG